MFLALLELSKGGRVEFSEDGEYIVMTPTGGRNDTPDAQNMNKTEEVG